MKKRLLIIITALMLVVAISLGVGLSMKNGLFGRINANASFADKDIDKNQQDINSDEVINDNNLEYCASAIPNGFIYIKEPNGVIVNDDDRKVCTLISSIDELKALCEECNYPAFSSNGYNINGRIKENKLTQKINGYNEEFFNNKALIVYTFIACNGCTKVDDSTRYQVTKVSLNNEILQLDITDNLDWECDGDIADSETPWTVLIEVNKADIANVTKIEAFIISDFLNI